MIPAGYPNGISVLVPTQNEEAMVGLCLRSFLSFGDELIVVDNGSTDRTKEIVAALAAQYPEKIRFFDKPDLPDLYHNRQFALQQARFRWIVRLDSDYVAYTSGQYDIGKFREQLMQMPVGLLPKFFAVRQPNVTGDFWHTGRQRAAGEFGANDPGRYVPGPLSRPMVRIYERFRGFRFQRNGRWEGVRFQRMVQLLTKTLPEPLWFHCNLKSNLNHLFRSERTNWRQLGDYETYPTLESYLRERIAERFDTDDLEEAAQQHFLRNIKPFLIPYEPDTMYPYPRLLQEQMSANPIFRLETVDGAFRRQYYGPEGAFSD